MEEIIDLTEELESAIRLHKETTNRNRTNSLRYICHLLRKVYVLQNGSKTVGKKYPAVFQGVLSTTPLKMSFEVSMKYGDQWKPNSYMNMTLWDYEFPEPMLIDTIDRLQKTDVGRHESISVVTLIAPRENTYQLLKYLQPILKSKHIGECYLKFAESGEDIISRRSVHLFNDLLKNIECSALILEEMYGSRQILPLEVIRYLNIYKRIKLEETSKKTAVLRIGGEEKTIQLVDEQEQAITECCGTSPTVCVEAPFGTGKTMVGAHLSSLILKSDPGPIIVVAPTNVAVGQFTDYLLSTLVCGEVRAARFVTENYHYFVGNIREDHMVTDGDLPNLMKVVAQNYQHLLSPQDYQMVQEYNSCRDFVLKNVKLAKLADTYQQLNLSPSDLQHVKTFIECARTADRLKRRIIPLLFITYKPNVLLATVDFLLRLMEEDFFKAYIKNTQFVIVDEASQLHELSFLVLLSSIPHARYRFFGDSHQLRPYSVVSKNDGNSLSVLERLKTNRHSTVVHLRTTFRAHPALNKLPNALVYNNQLINGTTIEQRDVLQKMISFPNKEVPMLFFDSSNGLSEKNPETQSWKNNYEEEYCLLFVRNLFSKGFKGTQIAIVCYYLDQKREIEDNLAGTDVEVRTIDSIQGREKDIVIILTTRTFGKNMSFLGDRRRTIVALTRVKIGLFIIGKIDFLKKNSFWNKIIQHFQSYHAVIKESQVHHCFSSNLLVERIVYSLQRPREQTNSQVAIKSNQTNLGSTPTYASRLFQKPESSSKLSTAQTVGDTEINELNDNSDNVLPIEVPTMPTLMIPLKSSLASRAKARIADCNPLIETSAETYSSSEESESSSDEDNPSVNSPKTSSTQPTEKKEQAPEEQNKIIPLSTSTLADPTLTTEAVTIKMESSKDTSICLETDSGLSFETKESAAKPHPESTYEKNSGKKTNRRTRKKNKSKSKKKSKGGQRKAKSSKNKIKYAPDSITDLETTDISPTSTPEKSDSKNWSSTCCTAADSAGKKSIETTDREETTNMPLFSHYLPLSCCTASKSSRNKLKMRGKRNLCNQICEMNALGVMTYSTKIDMSTLPDAKIAEVQKGIQKTLVKILVTESSALPETISFSIDVPPDPSHKITITLNCSASKQLLAREFGCSMTRKYTLEEFGIEDSSFFNTPTLNYSFSPNSTGELNAHDISTTVSEAPTTPEELEDISLSNTPLSSDSSSPKSTEALNANDTSRTVSEAPATPETINISTIFSSDTYSELSERLNNSTPMPTTLNLASPVELPCNTNSNFPKALISEKNVTRALLSEPLKPLEFVIPGAKLVSSNLLTNKININTDHLVARK